MPGPRIPVRVRHLTGDVLKDRADAERDELAAPLRELPFLRGRLISVRFAGAQIVVSHRLGVPARFIQVSGGYTSGGGPIAYESASQAGLDLNHQMRVEATDSADLDLWFYPRASKAIDPSTGQSR